MKVSTSKSKLLKDIADKLKLSRANLNDTPTKRSQNYDPASPTTSDKQFFTSNLSKSRVNKLESMLKGIKKCNQMSTKAVYSVKKNVKESIGL